MGAYSNKYGMVVVIYVLKTTRKGDPHISLELNAIIFTYLDTVYT